MKVMLVHGMGRTPLSMRPLARDLRRSGLDVELFGYATAWESIDTIVARLTRRLEIMAASEYVVVGHSLGGLLLRLAIAALGPGIRKPRRLIMLGTPNQSPRLARRFERAWWYRLMNGDAGRLLASPSRLAAIPGATIPCTIIAGTHGIYGRWSPFGDEQNDGLVAVSETHLGGATETILLRLRHPFMMGDPALRALLRERCRD